MGILLRLLALYLGSVPLYAGTTGATHLLTRGPGAEAAALGNAVLSTVQDPTALYWNPAGLAYAGGAVTGEHLFLVDGARYNFVGFSLPSRLGAFGLGMIQLHRGNIVARKAIDDPGFKVSNTQSDYLLGFARRFGRWWSAGTTLNVLDINLAGQRDFGLGLDLGFQGAHPGKDLGMLRRTVWVVGSVLKNLIEPGLQLKDDKETLPRELRVGGGLGFDGLSRLSFQSGEIHHDRVNVLASLRKVIGEPTVHFALGLSYTLHDLLTFRLGFEDNLVAGMGFTTGDRRFVVDYALENKPLSKKHRFTLSYRFAGPKTEPVLPPAVERDDGYQTARRRAKALSDEHFARGKTIFADHRYEDSLEDFELAALLYPDDPKRERFFRRAQEVHRRARVRDYSEKLKKTLTAGSDREAYRTAAGLLAYMTEDRQTRVKAVAALRSRLHETSYMEASREVLATRRPKIALLIGSGEIPGALRAVEDLEIIQTTATAAGISALSRWVAEKVRDHRAGLKAALDQAKRPGDALEAARAIARAFPQDAEALGEAEKARKSYLAGLSLGANEKLYLRKLYYLAAWKYAKRDYAAAGDLLAEVLRRNAADEAAGVLRDTMLRQGLISVERLRAIRGK